MEFYLDSESINLWDVVLDGWTHPFTKEGDKEILTARKDWSKEERKPMSKIEKLSPSF